MSGLVDVEDALRRVLARVPRPVEEAVDLADALNRVLARDVSADGDHPPFRRSKVDGFAVRAAETTGRPGAPAGSVTASLRVVCEVAAGKPPGDRIGPGQAARIFTGAAVPEGADAVVMQERCEVDGEIVHVGMTLPAGHNIVPRGSECAASATVVRRGRVLRPATLGVLASVGVARPSVYRRPCVRVVSTGDELVAVEDVPGPGQIRNSNARALAAAVTSAGGVVAGVEFAADVRPALDGVIERALSADVAIITGGVSVGDYDLVPAVLDDLGVEQVFHGVLLRPGKPLWFGVRGKTLVFGLPGNPVSALVNAALFVRPAVRAFQADPAEAPRSVSAELVSDLPAGSWRRCYVPAVLRESGGRLSVDPSPLLGSGDLFGFDGADALIVVPVDAPARPAGTLVEVVPLAGVPW